MSTSQLKPDTHSEQTGTTWPRVTVRPAVVGELPHLHQLLAEQADYFEQNPLDQSIVFVADYGGEVAGFVAARLQFQIEPLLLTNRFKACAPRSAQRKATYLLIREIDAWIGDRSKNRTGIHYYFCHIRDRTMQKLALSFGMIRVYFGRFFGREV